MRRPYVYYTETVEVPSENAVMKLVDFGDKTIEIFEIDKFALELLSKVSATRLRVMDIRVDGFSLVKHAKQRRAWSSFVNERTAEHVDPRKAGRGSRFEFWIENSSSMPVKLRLALSGMAIARAN
jgi:hypothetical protein